MANAMPHQMVEVDGVLYQPDEVPTKVTTVVIEEKAEPVAPLNKAAAMPTKAGPARPIR